MADVFNSYARTDAHHARTLAYFLESKGYSVWWDTELVGGDSFRKEITAALDDARAAIVIWSPRSVQSDWVVSEASRADDDGKLIAVVVPGFDRRSIPQPLEKLHLLKLGDEAGLIEAVERRISRPITEGRRWKMARHELLATGTALCTAISLFVNMEGFFKSARAVRLLLDNWLMMTNWLWASIFYAVRISPADAQALTLLSFFSLSMLVSTTKKARARPDWSHGTALACAIMFAVFFAGLKKAYLVTTKDSYGGPDGSFFLIFFQYAFEIADIVIRKLPAPDSGSIIWQHAWLVVALYMFCIELMIAAFLLGLSVIVFFVTSRILRRRLSWRLLRRRFTVILVLLGSAVVINQALDVAERYWQQIVRG